MIAQVQIDTFLSAPDAARAARVFAKLARHDTSGWVLAGGFALEVHRQRLQIAAPPRPLHDIDFLVDSFDRIPTAVAEDFAFRHIHPFDPPAKTLLQAVDLENAVRVDVFRAYGSVIERSELAVTLNEFSARLISLEDIVARLARLCWDLAARGMITAKYANDLFATSALPDEARLEAVWQDHRKPYMLPALRETLAALQEKIRSQPDLLVSPEYSKDTEQICERCHETGTLRLAKATTILATLGYC